MATGRKVQKVAGTGQTVGAADADLVTFAGPQNTVMVVEARVAGKTSGMDVSAHALTGCVKRSSGNASIVGLTSVSSQADTALLTTSASLAISGSNVILRATGVILQTVDWFGEARLWEN